MNASMYIQNWSIYKNGNIITVNDKMRTHADKYKAASKITCQKTPSEKNKSQIKKKVYSTLISINHWQC